MKTLFLAGSAIVALLVTAPAARAQATLSHLSLEVNGGPAIPTYTFGASDGADTGIALGASVVYGFSPAIAAYAGYSRAALPCESSACGSRRYVSSGVSVGGELALLRHRSVGSMYPWVRGGVLLRTLERGRRGEDADFHVDSDLAVGYEVRAGVGVTVTPRVTLLPGAGYSRYRAEFDGDATGAGPGEIKAGVLTADIALRVRL